MALVTMNMTSRAIHYQFHRYECY